MIGVGLLSGVRRLIDWSVVVPGEDALLSMVFPDVLLLEATHVFVLGSGLFRSIIIEDVE